MFDYAIANTERYERFIRRVVEHGMVWGLRSPDGWAYCWSNESDDADVAIIVFWSDRAYAANCAKDEWQDYRPEAIPLEEFLERWLPGMAADGVLAGTNWNVHLCGREAKPLELKSRLEEALSIQVKAERPSRPA